MRSALFHRRAGAHHRAAPDRGTALHPERTADPAVLRWLVHGVVLPFAGPLVSAPGLDGLLGSELEGVEADPGCLLVTAAPGRDWHELGPLVRTALITALKDVDAWVPGPHAQRLGPDEALRWCAQELIDGPVGEIATAHGGSIELVEAREGVVRVRMRGACRGCPAAVITMKQRLEAQLRRRAPGLRGVEEL